MKRIAIISPCLLPVPATLRGAVEGLRTRIIEDNERHRNYAIDLFTIDHEDATVPVYSCTNIIKVKPHKFTGISDRVLDKYYRTVHGKCAARTLDNIIVKTFSDRVSELKGGYDAVVIENMMSTACEIVRLCNGKYSFPVYFHMHNDIDIYRCPEQIRELVRFGVQFIAVSEYIKGQILKYDGNATVSVLYNGVDYSKYLKSDRRSEDLISFLYVGRIIREKGVKELAMAFTQALESADATQREKLRLTIVGFSEFDKGYEQEVRSLSDKCSNITCLDQVPAEEMSSLYDTADVVVMPTIDEEPFGLVALETMAKGIPLIVTDSGALPEVVGEGAQIVFRANGIVNNLSNAILKLAFDREYRENIAELGYDRAHSTGVFDINNYYNGFTQAIEKQEITDDDKISVVIPVYNVSGYLRRCVDSITTQTYRNIEIILIDDGSIDDSGFICDELAASDGRIKAIHQNNLGLSGARNTGLDNAAGRYIFFCDSDDYLAPEALDMMLCRLKTDHADIVACGIEKVFETDDSGNIRTELFTDTNPGRWSGRESVIQMMRSNNVCTTAWNKLYKTELFEGVRFPVGVYNEDEATTYKLLYRAGVVSFIPDGLYKYYQRNESIMHEDIENRYRFFMDAAIDRIDYFKERGETELEQHSRITLLEWIKYSYRNIEDKEKKIELVRIYKDNVNNGNAPSVMGTKKKMALLTWKYLRY